MTILVFRTDIKTKKKAKKATQLLNQNNHIIDCFIDIKDIDNVLRIETTSDTKEHEIIVVLKAIGFQCETLNY